MFRVPRIWLATLTLFSIASLAATQDAAKPLFEKAGELSKDDPNDKLLVKSPAKVYEFPMQAGKGYRIDLTSKDFLPVIRLESPEGKPLAADAKSGDDDNARLVVKAPTDGAYKLIVTTVPRDKAGTIETGKYRLTVITPTGFDMLGLRVLEVGKMPAEEREKTLAEFLAYLQDKGKAIKLGTA